MTKNQWNKLTVREATVSDAAAIARLLEGIEAKTVTAAYVLQNMEKTKGVETALLAESAGKIIGMLCLRVVPGISLPRHHAEVSELYIKPDQRGNQFEKEMLLQAESMAKEKGASQITLLTGQKNSDAQTLYQSLGYRIFAIAMRKQINS